MSCLNQQYEEKVRPCIDLIDSLRSLGVEKDLALPAIAVIGDQSSGKSSVLEALSGVPLPRGNGTVCVCVCVFTYMTELYKSYLSSFIHRLSSTAHVGRSSSPYVGVCGQFPRDVDVPVSPGHIALTYKLFSCIVCVSHPTHSANVGLEEGDLVFGNEETCY